MRLVTLTCQAQKRDLDDCRTRMHTQRMAYIISRNGNTIWRAGATADELVRVEAIDAQLQQIEAARAELTAERHILIRRACGRGRYAAAKKLAAE